MPDMSDIVDIEDIIIAPAGSLENAEISDAKSEKTPDPVQKVIGDEENEGTGRQDIEKVDGSIVLDYSMLKDDVVLQTKEVANICGISEPQVVRNLLVQWEPLLKVKRDDKNRAMWTKEDVGKFQELLEVKKSHNLTIKGVVDYYMNPTSQMLGEDQNALMPAGFDANFMDAVMKRVTDTVTMVMERKFEEQMNAMRAEIDSLKELPRLPDENAIKEAHAALEELRAKEAEKEREISQLKETRENMERDAKTLREENADLKAKVDELSKRKPLFGLWKKS